MKIIADTNVLVRLAIADDEAQSRVAFEALEQASLIAISLHSLCELTWVLDRRYGVGRKHIADVIRHLLGTSRVVVNRPAAEAGLSALEAGGDFADGAIAYEGRLLGGEIFVSFDKKAVKLLQGAGRLTHLLK